MNVRVTTVAGQEVEIPHHEVTRIAKMHHYQNDDFHQKVALRNEHYTNNALEGIRSIAARNGYHNVGNTEGEIKELLSCMLGSCPDLGDLIVEIIEQRIGEHHEKIYSE